MRIHHSQSIVIKIGIALCGLFLVMTSARAEVASHLLNKITHPLLQIPFDQNQFGYKKAPGKIQIIKPPGQVVLEGEYWIFADYDDSIESGKKYMLITGVGRSVMLTNKGVIIDNTNVMLSEAFVIESPVGNDASDTEARGNVDALEVPSYNKLPDRVVYGLLRSAVDLAITGYGGKEQLRQLILRNSELSYSKALVEVLSKKGINLPREKLVPLEPTNEELPKK